jgi:uncharacterized repeat protein (TIGR03803 family)
MLHRMGRVCVAVALVLVATGGSSVAAQEFEVLATFDNPPQWPTGGLVAGPDGLYGVANGGSYDYGSIFRFVPPDGANDGSVATLYSFPDTDYAANLGRPTHGLVFASDGNFYGLRTGGSWSGYTAAYRVTPAGAQTLLHFFVWPDDGGNPEGPLVEFDGALYGTCRWGGDPALPASERDGTVFRLELDGTMTRLHTFTGGVNGDRPEGGLAAGVDGLLYGTTLRGGAYGNGTLFSVDPASGAVEILHSFNPTTDGSGPTGELTVGADGAFYGAATYGDDAFSICGTIFRFDPAAASDGFTVLHAFSCAAGETKYPTGGMVLTDGSLYGTTYGESIDWKSGDGVVFRIALDTLAFDTLWSHDPDEVISGALVMAPDGFIYGQAYGRGTFWVDAGSILRIDPGTGSVETVFDLGRSDLPRKPFSLVEGDPGELLLVAREGGETNRGSIFRRTVDGAIAILHEFDDGSPYSYGATGFLTRGSDGLFYGTRSNGGAGGTGSVFTIDGEGDYNELYAFDGVYPWADGRPQGALIESRFEPGIFYGTLAGGGFDGGVFSIDAAGNLDFLALTETITGSPRGRLVQTDDGTLYGVVAEWFNITGGYPEYGGLFRVGPSGGFSRFARLDRLEGSQPQAGLTARTTGNGTFFYGTGSTGGASYDGTVFKLSTSEEVFAVHSFTGDDGTKPLGEMALAGDGRLYGSTREGGAYGYGTLFAVTADDEVVTLHHFDHETGAFPESAVIVGSDGNVYGVTTGGGPGGGGVIFRYNLAPNVTISGPSEIDEGSGAFLTADAVDPQGGPVSFVWDLDGDGEFDDGTGPEAFFAASTPETDGPGVYAVAVRATDSSGISTLASVEMTVRNVAPEVSVGPASAETAPGASVSFEVSYDDPGPDTWTAAVDWGDGTVETIGPVTQTFTVSHAFADPGTFTVRFTVADDDGGEGAATATVIVGSVNNLIEDLIDDVRELIDDGEISNSRGRSLIAELQVALWFLKWNNGETQAIVRMQLFIIKTQNYITNGQVDPELGNELIAKAQAIIELLR